MEWRSVVTDSLMYSESGRWQSGCKFELDDSQASDDDVMIMRKSIDSEFDYYLNKRQLARSSIQSTITESAPQN